MAQPIRILHLITGLNTGGAELALARLVESMDRHEFENRVVCLIPYGPVGKRLEDSKIQIDSLYMHPGRVTFSGFIKLIRIIRKFHPDILQTWLYHADLIGLIAGKLMGSQAIAWNIRGSESNFMNSQLISKIVAKMCAILSRWPTAVFVNSNAGKTAHENMGYHPRTWFLIQNGIDTTNFSPNRDEGKKVREQLNIPEAANVIGFVSRLDPQKGHLVLFRAAKIVIKEKPNTYFVCVGSGPNKYLEELMKDASDYGVGMNIVWTGDRNDMPAVYNSFNLFVSASIFGEGFPNVIAESMSCGIPCIATKTGDSSNVVGDTGLIVPTKNHEALAEAILQMLNSSMESQSLLATKARQRVISKFSLGKMVQEYSDAYRQLINSNRNF